MRNRMKLSGYAGYILYINLTDRIIRKKPLDPELARKYIGGAGINIKLAHDLIPPNIEPLSPQNAIIIGTGPFNGTIIPGSSRISILYKSPLNRALTNNNGGGIFSCFLNLPVMITL